eukprot:gene7256-8064_t
MPIHNISGVLFNCPVFTEFIHNVEYGYYTCQFEEWFYGVAAAFVFIGGLLPVALLIGCWAKWKNSKTERRRLHRQDSDASTHTDLSRPQDHGVYEVMRDDDEKDVFFRTAKGPYKKRYGTFSVPDFGTMGDSGIPHIYPNVTQSGTSDSSRGTPIPPMLEQHSTNKQQSLPTRTALSSCIKRTKLDAYTKEERIDSYLKGVKESEASKKTVVIDEGKASGRKTSTDSVNKNNIQTSGEFSCSPGGLTMNADLTRPKDIPSSKENSFAEDLHLSRDEQLSSTAVHFPFFQPTPPMKHLVDRMDFDQYLCDCVSKLPEDQKNGTFLIRDSQSSNDKKVLTIYMRNQEPSKSLYHYKICFNEEMEVYIPGTEEIFKSLDIMIDFYRKENVPLTVQHRNLWVISKRTKVLEMSSDQDADKYASNCSRATDWLKLYDGNSSSSTLLAHLCGPNRPTTAFTTSSNNLHIHFHTDPVDNFRGFLLQYKGICQHNLSASSGIIESPNYPNNYPSVSKCSWVIDFGPGIYVKLEFTSFSLEEMSQSCFDYVSIHNGSNEVSPLVHGTKKYCGSTTPPSVVHLGALTVYFESDRDTAKNGFSLTYTTWDNNECLNPSACHSNATCTNTHGSYLCKCKHSYSGDGKSCVWYREFDECSTGNHNCHVDATCVDTRGEFYCRCRSGFIGNGTYCKDLNECTTGIPSLKHNCHRNATCSNTIGSFTCTCVDVYTGDGVTCNDECLLRTDNCSWNAGCSNTIGSYSCHCRAGFIGDGFQCGDKDECMTGEHKCNTNARCNNTVGSYACQCEIGFTGDGILCEDIDECVTGMHSCSRNALCNNTISSYKCSCSEGFSGNGQHCEDIDECTTGLHVCHVNASCTNTNGSYACLCLNGYSGDGAICLDVDECQLDSHNCHVNATCTNIQGAYLCKCVDGFFGSGVQCSDVNECSLGSHECHRDSSCTNTIGSYNCNCNKGYEGNGSQCRDVDECSTFQDSCHVNSVCNNTAGSYYCFNGTGITCTDIDECHLENHDCHANGFCSNTFGSYNCSCLHGYHGDGFLCEDIDECQIASHNCSGVANCSNQQGSYSCTCLSGYNGDGFICNDINECDTAAHNCHRRAVCSNRVGSFSCSCIVGYTGNGTFCEDEDECQSGIHACHINAHCVNTAGSYACFCNAGYSGNGTTCNDVDECQMSFTGNGYNCTDLDECQEQTHNCHSAANCNNVYGSFSCFCNTGFKGNDEDECLTGNHQCSNDSTCDNTEGSYTCTCRTGFIGDGYVCNDTDECTESLDNCHSNATCTNTPGSYKCNCNIGYNGTGIDCQDVDECTLGDHNCHSKANCSNSEGSYSCTCSRGFIGSGRSCNDTDECTLKIDDCSRIPLALTLKGNTPTCVSLILTNAHRKDTTVIQMPLVIILLVHSLVHATLDTPAMEQTALAACNNLKGSYYCTCETGYTGNGYSCTDIDECSDGSHSCSTEATCRNVEGSYSCFCKTGFTGSGTYCQDNDECFLSTHNCNANSACANTFGSFTCSCNKGYSGDGINCKVLGSSCFANRFKVGKAKAACNNLKGSYYCTCETGYTGNGYSCTDIDECFDGSHACSTEATCTNVEGSYLCFCKTGFTGNGTYCLDNDECLLSTHNCNLNSACANTFGSFTCSCNKGYSGDGINCKGRQGNGICVLICYNVVVISDVDECSFGIHSCHQKAACNNLKGSYYCTCETGYTGNGYSCTDIDECFDGSHSCSTQATCRNVESSYLCFCKTGFTGNGTYCLDNDECLLSTHNCNANSACANTFGSFTCSCNKGYIGDGINCQDVDECSSQRHNCHADASCNNTQGSYLCTCNTGYHGNVFNCTDLDECSLGTHQCHADAECINIKGLYLCWCKTGYYGNGFNCTDIDECQRQSHSCHVDAQCSNTNGSYKCFCKKGFTGNGLQCLDMDECRDGTHNCHTNATCANNKGSFLCTCNSGYSGDGRQCSDIGECSLGKHNCHRDAKCKNLKGSYSCICHAGYSDINECSIASNTPAKLNKCHKQATCINTKGSYECRCNVGHTGNGTFCTATVNRRRIVKILGFPLNEMSMNVPVILAMPMRSAITPLVHLHALAIMVILAQDLSAKAYIDECQSKIHSCDIHFGICLNSIGSYNCRCREDLVGNGRECAEPTRAFHIIVNLLQVRWNLKLAYRETIEFKNLASSVENNIKNVFSGDAQFLSVKVTSFSFGSVKIAARLDFIRNATLPNRRLEAAVKRGKLYALKVIPDSLKMTALDIDECDVFNGGCHHSCFNVNGTYSCHCHKGFLLASGDRLCVIANDVLSSNTKVCPTEWNQNLKWHTSVSGQIVQQNCPESHTPGIAQRMCLKDGNWGIPVMTACKKSSLNSLLLQTKASSSTSPRSSLLSVLKNLATLTSPLTETIYAGDVITAMDIMQVITAAINASSLEKSSSNLNDFYQIFFKAAENLANEKNSGAWKGMKQTSNEIFRFIKLVEDAGKVVCSYQIELMKNNSLTKPELLSNLGIAFQTSSINAAIKIVEQSTFSGYKWPSSTISSSYAANVSVTFPKSLFETAAQYKLRNGIYTHLGCYADSIRNRVLPNIEGTDQTLTGNFLTRENAILKCAVVAKQRGFKVFGIQDGGWCAGSLNGHETYYQYGRTNNCVYGKGGMLSFDVYAIKQFFVGISTISFKSLGALLSRPTPSSNVFPLIVKATALLDPETLYSSLEQPIKVSFSYKVSNESIPVCGLSKKPQPDGSLKWNVQESRTQNPNQRIHLCKFLSFGTYGLLLNVTNEFSVSKSDDSFYKSLSYTSCGISCFFLIITVIMEICLRYDKTLSIVHGNCAIVAILAQSLFLFGRKDIPYQALCKFIAILLHYLVISVFAWIVAECMHLYRALIQDHASKKMLSTGRYFALGYGSPLAATALSVAIFYDKYVFNGLQGNIIVFGMVLGVYNSEKSTSPLRENIRFYEAMKRSTRDGLRASVLVAIIMYMTWCLAIMSILKNSVIVTYAYLACNALQIRTGVWLMFYPKRKEIQLNDLDIFTKSCSGSENCCYEQNIFSDNIKDCVGSERELEWDTRM